MRSVKEQLLRPRAPKRLSHGRDTGICGWKRGPHCSDLISASVCSLANLSPCECALWSAGSQLGLGAGSLNREVGPSALIVRLAVYIGALRQS